MTVTTIPKVRPNAAEYRDRIRQGDPVLSLVARRKLSPIAFGLAVALAINLARLAVAWRDGTLFTTSPVGFFRDPAAFLNMAFAIPVFAWYAWTPAGLGTLIAGLLSNRVFRIRGRPTFVDEVIVQLCRRRWLWLAYGGAIGASLMSLPGYLARMAARDSWSMATPASVALSLIWAATGFFAAFRIVTYYAVVRMELRRLFARHRVRVRPLHPDRCGGLAPLGVFSIRVSYLMTLLAAFLVVTVMTRSYLAYGEPRLEFGLDLVVGFPVLALLSAFIFFALPAVAHDSMSKAKDLLLMRINRRFETEYRLLQKNLEKPDTDLESGLKRLGDLQKLHETTSNFPVWPFDVRTLSRFASSWLTPIAIAALTTLVKVLLD